MLDEPAALAGDAGEAGLGVDRHGEPDRFEQREVRRRVGVGHALLEPEALGVAVVGEQLGAGLAGRGHRRHLARVGAVGPHAHLGGDDLVEQRLEPGDVERQRTGDQDRAVAGGLVLADPPQALGKRLRHDQLSRHLDGVFLDLGDRRVLVAAVEVAEEVGAVATVELEQAGRLGERAQHVAHSFRSVQAAGGEERVALDDVRGDQRVLEVEGCDVAGGVEHLAPQARHPVGAARRAGRGLDPSVLDDRGQVDLGDVAGPVDDPRVEAERLAVGVVERVPQGDQVVDLVDRLALGVEAVQLDVLQRRLDLVALGLERRRELGSRTPQRKRMERLLRLGEHVAGAGELPLDAAAAREVPFGHEDRLALGVVERMLGEPAADVVDHRPVLERIDPAGGHLRDRWCLLGAGTGDRDQGGDDEVDRDHVDRALRNAGELLQQAAGVRDDDRLGHPEAADPAGAGLGPRRLDDRRSHDRHRHVALAVGERLLAERLGEGVGVGPADAGGACATSSDQLVLDPAFPELLGLGRERRGAGGTELGPRRLAELGEALGLPTQRLGVALQAAGGVDLGLPAQPDVERSVAHQFLGGVAAAVAGDVAGADGDEMGGGAEVVAQPGDAGRPEQVDLDRPVERRVERDGGSGVDHDLGSAEDLAVGLTEPEAVSADVAGDRGHPAVGHLLERLGAVRGAVRLAEAVEGVVPEQFLLRSLGGGGAPAVADQQNQLASRDAAQQAFDERGAHEPGRAGDGDPLSGQCFRDHGPLF